MSLFLHCHLALLVLVDVAADNEEKDDDEAGDDTEDAARRHDDWQDDQHVQRTRHAFREHGDRLEN